MGVILVLLVEASWIRVGLVDVDDYRMELVVNLKKANSEEYRARTTETKDVLQPSVLFSSLSCNGFHAQ